MGNESCRLNDCNFDVERGTSYLHSNLFIVGNRWVDVRFVRWALECWPRRIDRIHTHTHGRTEFNIIVNKVLHIIFFSRCFSNLQLQSAYMWCRVRYTEFKLKSSSNNIQTNFLFIYISLSFVSLMRFFSLHRVVGHSERHHECVFALALSLSACTHLFFSVFLYFRRQ